MYVDKEMVEEAVGLFHSGEMELAEFSNLVDWYDGDIFEIL